MKFFEKPLDQLTCEDINWLIENEVREGQTFELKSALSADKGTVEPWTSGENKIGRTAVAALVRELVSFANSQGGTLVLGVAEGGERPARATAIMPVRAAVQLAERLKRTCPDNFDPPVYGFEIVGIETEEDGSGVVIMRIPASPYGPHRSRADKECYVRRNDEAMSIGMDEIHRRVVEMSRRLRTLDDKFKMARIAPDQMPLPQGDPTWMMRAVALPTGPLFVPDLLRIPAARPNAREIPVVRGQQKYQGTFLARFFQWRPVVQGVKGLYDAGDSCSDIVLKSDGSIVFDWRRTDANPPYRIAIEWFIGLFGNTLLAIERMRLAAKAPSMEYNVEFQIASAGFKLAPTGYVLADYASSGFGFHGQHDIITRDIHSLSRYPISARSDFDDVTRAFEADTYHLAGIDSGGQSSFDYSGLLSEIDREFASN